jgi:signal transduction histidine kinase
MNDALEILNELTDILDLTDEFNYEELYEQVRTYIFNKRHEFEPACGDCAG